MCIADREREGYLTLLKEKLKPKRLVHTLGVEKLAIQLAKKYGADVASAQRAALLHDLAKSLKKQEMLTLAYNYNIEVDEICQRQPDLLHGALSAEWARRELGLQDEDMLNAIRFHTTGRAGMSPLEKIIYLADLLEENRDFPGVEELREATMLDLNQGFLEGMAHVLTYVIAERTLLHPRSIEAYNDLISLGG